MKTYKGVITKKNISLHLISYFMKQSDKTHYSKRLIEMQWIVSLLCVLLLFPIRLEAQFYNGSNLSFGKNRIQHETRVWSYYRTPYADIYYYPQSKELAVFVANKIPEILDEMEKRIGIAPEQKIQVIIYARQSDFMQSNIGLASEDFYNTGGVTSVYGDKIFLYFKDNLNTFLSDLRGSIANLLIANLIVGSDLRSNISSSYFAAFPYWFTGGLSMYLSHKGGQNALSAEVENQIKDGITSKRYQKIYKLSYQEQQLAGYSFWEFIAQRYGESYMPSILYYASATRNYERALLYALNTPFDQLFDEWLQYCKEKYMPKAGESEVEAEAMKFKKNTQYLYPILSSSANRIAYVTNKAGRAKVWIMDRNSPSEKWRRAKCIYRYHYRIEENPDYSFPLIAWHPLEDILTLMVESHDKVYFRNYNVKNKKFENSQIVFIDKITSFSYSDNGRSIALSGVKNGQSDIYIYHLTSRSLEQITNDKADDFAPRFIRNNTQLIFSSNRNNDTIGTDNGFSKNKFNLFVYDAAAKNKVLTRITNKPLSNETYAMEAQKDYISFLSDQNGINNRYLGHFNHVISHIDTAIHYVYRLESSYPISNNNTGILFQDINVQNAIASQQFFRKGQSVFGLEDYIRFSDVGKKTLTVPVLEVENVENDTMAKDSLSIEPAQPQTKQLRLVRLSDVVFSSDSAQKFNLSHWENEEEILANQGNNLTLIPRNYNVQYFINEMVTQVDFSFLNTTYQQYVKSSSPIYLNPGLSGLIKFSIRDLMEDHRMTGGFRISIDLNDMEFLYSYENLKKRWDKQFVVQYQTLKVIDYNFGMRQQNASLFYILSYPFDRVNRIKASANLRYNRLDLKAIDDISLNTKPKHAIWTGGKLEYTFDNTMPVATNMIRGLRGKLFAEYMCVPSKEFNNMTVLGLDVRHYTKAHNTLIWANRFAGSTSLGKNRLIYYMGGVDNWMGAKFNQEINIDTSVNYAYQTLATNMRGFTQNIRNGTTFFVWNTELRFQVIQCLAKKPLRSDFLRSFQLVAFGDVGTAWAGLHPYLESNALFTRTITPGRGDSYKITVHQKTEPIVSGFGLGARFILLGYFIRLDYAWGVEDFSVNKGIFYLSLNLDF